MFRRTASFLVLLWLFAFLWFAVSLPRPLEGGKTDAAVVLTGGEGRIPRGLTALRKGWTRQLLISGVDREVKPREFQAEYKVPGRLMECCVTLGYQSYDTRSNAREVSDWLIEHKARSVRLITTDWHMRRAVYELDQTRPPGITVLTDSVASEPSLRILFLEFHKVLARRLLDLWKRQG